MSKQFRSMPERRQIFMCKQRTSHGSDEFSKENDENESEVFCIL